MGAQTRYTTRHAPSWAATVGDMKAKGVEVYATCVKCGWTQNPLPLDPIIDKLGPEFSLFDRSPKCRRPFLRGLERCSGRMLLMYKPGGTHGTPYRPCRTTL